MSTTQTTQNPQINAVPTDNYRPEETEVPTSVKVLTGLRATLAVSAVLAPRLAGKAFGLDAKKHPPLVYMGRLFGARNAALAWTLASPETKGNKTWLAINVGADLADAAAALAGFYRKELSPYTAVAATSVALGAATLGLNGYLQAE